MHTAEALHRTKDKEQLLDLKENSKGEKEVLLAPTKISGKNT